MSWRPPAPVVSREGVWIRELKVDLEEVEVGDVYRMHDPESGSLSMQRVLAINGDKTLTVQDTWSYRVKNVRVDALVMPDYLSVSYDPVPIHWGSPLPLCKDDFNSRHG